MLSKGLNLVIVSRCIVLVSNTNNSVSWMNLFTQVVHVFYNLNKWMGLSILLIPSWAVELAFQR